MLASVLIVLQSGQLLTLATVQDLYKRSCQLNYRLKVMQFSMDFYRCGAVVDNAIRRVVKIWRYMKSFCNVSGLVGVLKHDS